MNTKNKSINFKLFFAKKSLFLFLTIIFVIGQSCTHRIKEDTTKESIRASSDPQFDWFKYVGDDPVYRGISVDSGEYINPIIAGFYPDPSIVRAGDDYYLVHSSFSYYPGIPVFHSKDLIHWNQVGFAMDRPSVLPLGGLELSAGLFAPSISYHNGTFYIINTFVGGGGNYIITATDPADTWSDPVWLKDIGGIDPSLFFDADGTAYILNNDVPKGGSLYSGHRAIWIRKYDLKNNEPIGEPRQIINGGTDISKHPIWIEGPHMMKVNGTYYLYAAQGGTGPNHSEVVFRGNSPMGPFTPYKANPILTQRDISRKRVFDVEYTGHADMVETQNGEWWCVFLGVRTYDNEYFNTGRETFLLPVNWKNGWPTILPHGDTVPVKLRRPDLPPDDAPDLPTHGNFTHKDEFNENKLGDQWTMIRTPSGQWWNLTDSGFLQIDARPESLNGKSNPSFIGRRQQNVYGSASTKMIYKPDDSGDIAGLAAFQSPEYYYLMGVTVNEDGERVIVVKKCGNGEMNLIASKTLQRNSDNTYFLKIQFRGGKYDFLYSLDKRGWSNLYTGADGTVLSTNRAGGFVGTVIGMYAYATE